ncbi:DUF4956 domain-containing protein [Kribbella sandramycini]|uniref:DUF4956 domain-containing protein n=1 Tax=Kribbella sandramycini TaxID=60450 RepID=A0A7Y4L2A1_9ACTN|nr:DUF4956 domain-containing protein [Kribbella sandramycini]MBB6564455.1 hypothetical protein [Kribbella sandramycini]NOL42161.1 DUF4956 domain-containing protein [Kribbella sandramycini]
MTGLAIALPADLLAVGLLAYGIYFRRYHRRDLLLAYVALNVGVLAVTAMLADSGAGAGLGLGLFGILSIIRLRSDSITQEEVAYYFVALAMGLVNGLHPGPVWLAPVLSLLLVAVMYGVDHPRLISRSHRQKVVLDRAYPQVSDIRPVLEQLLGAEVKYFVVLDLDLVTDTTVVDVRYRRRTDATRANRPAPVHQFAA